MKKVGNLSKMLVKATTPVTYLLPVGDHTVELNQALGKTVRLQFNGLIHCQSCHRAIKKSYQDGYCFPCTQTLSACDLCIVKPERCHFHLGTCREPQWGQTHCMNTHVVYLANASGIKVGITRKTQIPTRWIDQGAQQALAFIEVPHRRASGFVEVIIAKHIADKTNWRKMLSQKAQQLDLLSQCLELSQKIKNELNEIYAQFGQEAIKWIEQPILAQFEYPVLEYPKKITSLSFDKEPIVEGTLLGCKGQYLIFDKGVINIRKHSGYQIEITQS